MTTQIHRKHLETLCAAVRHAVAAIDLEMRSPSDHERGVRIARITNGLDVAHDTAMRYALGIGFRAISNRKRDSVVAIQRGRR